MKAGGTVFSENANISNVAESWKRISLPYHFRDSWWYWWHKYSNWKSSWDDKTQIDSIESENEKILLLCWP